MRRAQCVIYLLPSVLILAACSSGDGGVKTATSPSRASVTSTPTTATGGQPSSSPTATAEDLRVCAAPDGLETRGMPFSKTFIDVLKNNGTGQPTTSGKLSEELRALTTIGAPAGLSDGSEAIADASTEVRQAIRLLVQDAKGTLPSVSTGILPKQQLSDLMMSFTKAIAACKDAGYRVSWMEWQQ